jgi:hypothetical protein
MCDSGADVLKGSDGDDVFVFTSAGDSSNTSFDVIALHPDSHGIKGIGIKSGDVVDVSDIDAASGKLKNQTFIFGGADPHGGKGHL